MIENLSRSETDIRREILQVLAMIGGPTVLPLLFSSPAPHSDS